MNLENLEKEDLSTYNEKARKEYTVFESLIAELQKIELPDDMITLINQKITAINAFSGTNRDFLKLLKSSKRTIIKTLEKKLKIVPKNYYRNLWMALGMSAFGIPLGLVFSMIISNMAFLGIGLPIGMVIGMAVGSEMDKKASQDNRQLDLEISY